MLVGLSADSGEAPEYSTIRGMGNVRRFKKTIHFIRGGSLNLTAKNIAGNKEEFISIPNENYSANFTNVISNYSANVISGAF